MQLSDNFSLYEFIRSDTAQSLGITNEPTQEHKDNIQALVDQVLQPFRDKIRKPMVITSGYRGEELNKAVGGVSTSQHSKGEAVDFHVKGVQTHVLAKMLVDSGLPFDQLILEYGRNSTWIHVSHKRSSANRGEVLTAKWNGKKMVYHKGLVP